MRMPPRVLSALGGVRYWRSGDGLHEGLHTGRSVLGRVDTSRRFQRRSPLIAEPRPNALRLPGPTCHGTNFGLDSPNRPLAVASCGGMRLPREYRESDVD